MFSRSISKTIAATCLLLCLASIAWSRQEAPKIARKAGGVLVSEATNRVQPVYPPLAKVARISGTVVVEVTIDEEGNVKAARALSGHPLLKDSAVAAAQQWTFKPTLLNGEPVKVIGTITFNFTLPPSEKEMEALKEQVRSNPNSAEMHYNLGRAYSLNSQNDSAIEEFNRALQLKPDYAEAYIELSRIYSSQGEVERAIDTLKQSLSTKPDNANAQAELAQLYWRANKHEEAIDAARRALSLNPDLPQAFGLNLSLGMSLFSQQRYAEALEAFKKADMLNPNMPQLRLNLGKTYFMVGDMASAMKEYEFLKESYPEAAKRLMDFINKK